MSSTESRFVKVGEKENRQQILENSKLSSADLTTTSFHPVRILYGLQLTESIPSCKPSDPSADAMKIPQPSNKSGRCIVLPH
jgi:hypothetical protein